MRTTTQVVQGGAEVLRTQQVGGRGGHQGGGRRGGDPAIGPDGADGQRSLGRNRGRAQGQ